MSTVTGFTSSDENLHPPDGLTSGVLTATYRQGFNLEQWYGNILLNRMFGKTGSLEFDERLTVWLHHASGYQRQWKVNQQLDFTVQHPAKKPFDWLLTGEMGRFIDRQAHRTANDIRFFPLIPLEQDISFQQGSAQWNTFGGTNNITDGYLGLGGAYNWQKQVTLNSVIGPLYDNHNGFIRHGLRWTAGLDGSNDKNSVQVDGWLDRFPGGNDYGWSAVLRGDYIFAGQGSDNFTILYSGDKRRQSFSLAEMANRRYDETLILSNHLTTGGQEYLSSRSTGWSMSWDSQMIRQRTTHSGGNIDYSNREFVWRNDLNLLWDISRDLSGNVTAGVDLQQQQYTGDIIQGRRAHLGQILHYTPSSSDTLSLETRAIRYRYDTPDESDYNDRDELRYLIALNYGKILSPQINLKFRLEIDLHHLVYIYRARSGDNRWTRLLTLSSELPWDDGPINNVARFAVTSHYTNYDYSPATESMSRVYRSFTARDTLRIAFSRRFDCEADFALMVDDHGRFRWSDWVEEISEDGYGYTFALKPSGTISDYRISAGWSWHRRRTTLHLTSGSAGSSGETADGESIRSSGPLFSFTFPASRYDGFSGSGRSFKGLRAELTGSILWVDDRLRGSYRLPDIHLLLLWSF
ncbi:MAG: hypothetical protein P9M15_03850 [Candidatus Electryoneaceae bacterium]|nr:hypothetical protein [Candidatus Electryoneaceae bacterium]